MTNNVRLKTKSLLLLVILLAMGKGLLGQQQNFPGVSTTTTNTFTVPQNFGATLSLPQATGGGGVGVVDTLYSTDGSATFTAGGGFNIVTSVTNANPASHSAATGALFQRYEGSNQIAGGFGAYALRGDLFTKSGVDTQSGAAGGFFATILGNNTGNTLNDNNTSALALVAASSSNTGANSIAFDAVGQSTFNGTNQTQTVQASQLLTNVTRCPGWFADINCTYSSVESYNVQSGSNDLTVGTVRDTTDATHGYLFGDVVAAAKQVGHAMFRGANGYTPVVGYWCAASSVSCEYIGAKPWFGVNGTNSPSFNDVPAWGMTLGERSVISGQSNIEQFVSTNAGTSATISNSPTGATSSNKTFTFTTTAPHGFTNDVYHPIHIAGVTDAKYNIDCLPTAMASTTFSCVTSQNLPTLATTAATLSGNVVTLTMVSNPQTADFSTTQGVIVGGFSGADAFLNGVYTPTAVTATQIQYSLTHGNYTSSCVTSGATQVIPLCGTVTAQGFAASGSGTATQTVEQSWTQFVTPDAIHHFAYASPPNPGSPSGADVVLFGNTGIVTATGTTAAFTATSSPVTGTFRSASGGAVQEGATTNHRLDFLTNNVISWSLSTGGVLGPLTDGGNDLGASGSLRPNNGFFKNALTAASYQTATNCAVNSVSPAACGSAAAGVFAVPASQTTYTVNTTAVTANSRIFLEPLTDNTGIPSAPTCVAPSVVGDTVIASRVAATSFTITLATLASITCYNYFIVN